jgi:hypothetical protein
MNKSGSNENDTLFSYLKPEKLEKAPEGFTEKIMARINVEPSPLRTGWKLRNKNFTIPLVSIIVIFSLIVSAALTGNAGDSNYLTGFEKFLNSIRIPSFKIESFSVFTLPVVLIYIAFGLLILSVLDIALNKLFHHRKN